MTFSQDSYIFSENIQLTDTSSNQKFPEIIINDDIINISDVIILINIILGNSVRN